MPEGAWASVVALLGGRDNKPGIRPPSGHTGPPFFIKALCRIQDDPH